MTATHKDKWVNAFNHRILAAEKNFIADENISTLLNGAKTFSIPGSSASFLSEYFQSTLLQVFLEHPDKLDTFLEFWNTISAKVKDLDPPKPYALKGFEEAIDKLKKEQRSPEEINSFIKTNLPLVA